MPNDLAPYLTCMIGFCLLAGLLGRRSHFYSSLLDAQHSDRAFHRQINGMRGFLALSVFIHHAIVTQTYLAGAGWHSPKQRFAELLGPSSVTLFFFISGFLFWGMAIARGVPSPITSFYRKRIRRLFPAYLVSVLCIALTAWVMSEERNNQSLWERILHLLDWTVMSVPDDEWPALFGYRDTSRINAAVAWSVRIELLFYLFFPLLAVFARGVRPLLLLGGSYLAWRGLEVIVVNHWHHLVDQGFGAFVLPPLYDLTRFLWVGFLFGMVSAALKERLPHAPLLGGRGGSLLVVAALIVHVAIPSAPYTLTNSALLWVSFLPVVYGADLFGLLSSRPAQYLGTISYSIYLFHGIVLFVVTQISVILIHSIFENTVIYWCLSGSIGAAVIGIAHLSYRYIEHPFLTPARVDPERKALKESVFKSS